MSDEQQENPQSDDEGSGRDELLNYLADFMQEGRHAESLYRENFCELVVNKVFEDFGYEGLCGLMLKIDGKANWISDILIENSDFDDILFKKYGVYDSLICDKARKTDSMMELNSKIWRLRKRYASIIVNEIMTKDASK